MACASLIFCRTETIADKISFPGPVGMFDYDLFAVINHEGNMDNGHYTSFARCQDEVNPLTMLFPV